LYLTWQLVEAGGGQVYEVNPLAAVWLQSFGWVGLMVFKGLTTLLVALSALYVARHRPRTGGRPLLFACSATALVVAYSCSLALQADSLQAAETAVLLYAQQKSRGLDGALDRARRYRALRAQLGAELASQQLPLGAAVNRLAQTDQSQDPRWMGLLHGAYPYRSDVECLAIHLVHFTLTDLTHDPAARLRLAHQLEAEYRATYGSEVSFDPTDETTYDRPPLPMARSSAPSDVPRSKGRL
jgi:hypothetical protein